MQQQQQQQQKLSRISRDCCCSFWHKGRFCWCWHRDKHPVLSRAWSQRTGPRSNTFPEEEEPRCPLMPFKLLRMRSAEQTGLGSLTQLSFLHSAWPACYSSTPACGNTHYSFLFFFSPPSVKLRLGNEWGPFPQRGSGNVITDFPLTPLEVTGYIISLCF